MFVRKGYVKLAAKSIEVRHSVHRPRRGYSTLHKLHNMLHRKENMVQKIDTTISWFETWKFIYLQDLGKIVKWRPLFLIYPLVVVHNNTRNIIVIIK